MYIKQNYKGYIIQTNFFGYKLNIYLTCATIFFKERINLETRNILKINNLSRDYCLKYTIFFERQERKYKINK